MGQNYEQQLYYGTFLLRDGTTIIIWDNNHLSYNETVSVKNDYALCTTATYDTKGNSCPMN